jgi:hypothetical protein
MDKNAAYADLRKQIRAGVPYFDAGTMSRFHRIAEADIRSLPEGEIRSGGFVVNTLEAALWCFLTTDTYKDAVLKAVNLGDDTDTTAAVTGALAGLACGMDAIPSEWRETLALSDGIARLAADMARTAALHEGIKCEHGFAFAARRTPGIAENRSPHFLAPCAIALQTESR